MARSGISLGSLSLLFFFCCVQQSVGLIENYYATSCPRAEDIVKEQVYNLYEEHGNTAVSWVRLIFHDCIVQSCDASILLDNSGCAVGETIGSELRNAKLQVYGHH